MKPHLIPPVSLGPAADAAGWTSSWPLCHAAAKRCPGLRMNLLPWQESRHAFRCRHGGERQLGAPAAPPQQLFVVPFSHRARPLSVLEKPGKTQLTVKDSSTVAEGPTPLFSAPNSASSLPAAGHSMGKPMPWHRRASHCKDRTQREAEVLRQELCQTEKILREGK